MPVSGPIELVISMPDEERRSWLRTLAPDNAADLIRNPASASAPAAATLVDVSGLIIYFSVARVIMLGVLPGESES